MKKIILISLLGVANAFAQNGAGWHDVHPSDYLERAVGIANASQPKKSSDEAATQSSKAPQFLSLSSGSAGSDADHISPEIQALADGLQNDPYRIYQYCHDHIDFEAYWGCKKGATLTYLEGGGNSFDTSALMVSLLKASGFTNVSYRYAFRDFYHDPDNGFAQVQEWLGTASQLQYGVTPFPEISDTDFTSQFGSPPASGMTILGWRHLLWDITYLLSKGYPAVYPDFLGGDIYLLGVPHVWVQFTDTNGTVYELDPAHKTRNAYVDSTDNLALDETTYNRANFLSNIGGTTGANYVQNINETNLSNNLETYTAEVVSWFKGDKLNGSADEFFYDKSPITLSSSASLSSESLASYEYFGVSYLPLETWATIPDQWYTKLEVTFGKNYNETSDTFGSTYATEIVNTASLCGQKLSLRFNGNTATASFDDTTWQTFSLPDSSVDVRLKVDHPFGEYDRTTGVWSDDGFADQVEGKAYVKNDDFAYVFIYGFDPSGRHLRKRQEILQKYKRDGIADDDWRVRTEMLNTMGLTWVHQVSLAKKIINGKNHVLGLQHHTFGRMAQEEGFYVDVGLSQSGISAFDGNDTTRLNAFKTSSILASALEHALIEQMQGSDKSATSTVKILQLANTQGMRVYRANNSTWSGVRSTLNSNGYGAADLNLIEAIVTDPNEESRSALIPASPNVTLNQWNGTGYAATSSGTAGMIISGGYFGGYSSDNYVIDYAPISESFVGETTFYDTSGLDLSYGAEPVTTPAAYSNDPVDMSSGAFVLDKTDLVCGSGVLPRGIALSRHYSSNRRHEDTKGLGYGWTHNLDIFITERSAIRSSMGEATIRQMAPYFTGVYVAADLIGNESSAKEFQAGILATKWATDQLLYKGVSVTMGQQSIEFVQMPDGSYEPPAGITMSLTKNANDTYSLQERNGRTFNFNADHKLSTVVDQHGEAATFTYSNGNLSRVTDSYSRYFDFTYSGDRISKVEETAGGLSRDIEIAYTNDQLASFTDTEGDVSDYQYDAENRMTFLIDAKDEIIVENIYDAQSRVSTQYTHGDTNKVWNLYFSGYHNIEADSEGGEISYLFDDRGRSVGMIDQEGNQSRRIYDGEDHITNSISPKNGPFTIRNGVKTSYNADQNPSRITAPRRVFFGGTSYSADREYDSSKRLSKEYDFRGNFTEYAYTSQHQISSIKDRKGNTVLTNTYNSDGTINTVTDADGNVTTYSNYNAFGQAQTITYPTVGLITPTESFVYNTRGDLTSSTDRNGNTTTYQYNDRRQPTVTTLPATGGISYTVTNSYDECGNLASVTDSRGNITTNSYSATKKLLSTTFPNIEAGTPVISTSYDDRDWLKDSTDPLNNQTSFTYDSAKRLTVVTDPLNRTNQSAYNEDSEPISATDGLGNSSSTNFDLRGQVSDVTDAENRVTSFLYDADGNQTSLINRKNQTFAFTFDQNGRPLTTQTPTGKVYTNTYTDRGLLATAEQPSGDRLEFSYDELARLESVIIEDNGVPTSTINYVRDANGNPTSVTEGSESITRTFDEWNRVKTLTDANGNLLQFQYDGSSNLIKCFYPDGKEVDYTYNSHNQLKTVTDWGGRVTEYFHDLNGRLTKVNNANGSSCRYVYDEAGQLKGRSELGADGSQLSYYLFQYDAAGRITTEKFHPAPAPYTEPVITATYDDDNRLATFNGLSVTSDDDGNMTSAPLLSNALVNYAFDSRNRLTGVGGVSYSYDLENNVKRVIETSGVSSFAVDSDHGLSKVLTRTKGGETTYYVYGMGLLYEVDESENTKTYHFDYRGSTVALTEGNGVTVSDRIDYSPYGTTTNRIGTTDTPFLFNGKYGVMTFENGLISMRARHYNPYLTRFINSDPIRFGGGMNWYAYANGNPISYNDPEGTFANFVIGALIGGGLDYAFQVGANMANGKSFGEALSHNIDLGSIVISAGTGALTGGIGGALSKQGAKTAGQFAYNAAVNGAVNAAGGAGSQIVRNATDEHQDNLYDGVLESTVFGAATGATGSLVGDTIQNAPQIINSYTASQAMQSASSAQRQLAIGGSIKYISRSSSSGSALTASGASIIGSSISNYPDNPVRFNNSNNGNFTK